VRLLLAKFNFFQRLCRKCGFVRYSVMQKVRGVRKKQADARWAYEHSILASVGLFVTIWAGIERMLNTFIVNYHPHAAGNLGSGSLPVALNQKITYLASVAKDERLPEDFRSTIKAWVEELGRQRTHRHLLIHGVSFKLRKHAGLMWEFQKLELRGAKFELTTTVLSNDEIQAGVKRASDLSQSIAQVLNPLLFPDYLQTSSTNRP
jgi:hypothetical protein